MTTNPKMHRIRTATLGAIFASLLVIQACSSDDDPKPSGPTIGSGGVGTSGAGGRTSGGRAGATSGGRAGEDSGGAGNSTGDAGSAGTGPECTNPVGPNGCFNCEPTGTDDREFLNRCSDAQCAAFDNGERIPGWTGTLPELD